MDANRKSQEKNGREYDEEREGTRKEESVDVMAGGCNWKVALASLESDLVIGFRDGPKTDQQMEKCPVKHHPDGLSLAMELYPQLTT